MFEFRTDVATLQPLRRMDDGRIVAEALITKPGVFEYADAKYPGGIRRELRPDSEVYSRETMDSFANIPCTPVHPPALLTAATAKRHMVGSTGDKVTRAPVTGDSDWLKAGVMVADAATIKRMDAGNNATSCGYGCWIDETPGVDPKYGRYDVVQRRIRGNHLAVAVESGRAGRMARVRMDSELTPEERNALGDQKFAYPEAKKLPIENAAHVKAAMSRFAGTDFSKDTGSEARAYRAIVSAAKKYKIDSTGFEKSNGSRFDDDYMSSAAAEPELVALTTAVDGHQHTIDPADSSGCTSGAYSEGADVSHRHEWVRAVDGSIKIGENAGHTHEVDPATLGVRGDSGEASGGGPRGGRFDSKTQQGEPTMDELEKLKQANKALEAGLKASEAENAALKTRCDSAETAAGEAKGAIKTLEQERDALQVQIAAGATAVESEAIVRERTRADAAEEKVARFDEAIDDKVEARATLQFEAASVLGSDFKFRGLSDRQIVAATVKRMDASADVTDAVEFSYLKGRFDSLLRGRLARARQDANVSVIASQQTQQARVDSKAEKMKEYRSMGSKPLDEVLYNKKGA